MQHNGPCGGLPIPLQKVTSLRRCAQANTLADSESLTKDTSPTILEFTDATDRPQCLFGCHCRAVEVATRRASEAVMFHPSRHIRARLASARR